MLKEMLFTHTDLDGSGCSTVFNVFHKNPPYRAESKVDVTYCSYDSIDKHVMDFIESEAYLNYSRVYITDISIIDEVAAKIDSLNTDTIFTLFDHHEKALFLNKYDWCHVVVEKYGVPQCGASLLLQHLFDRCVIANDTLVSPESMVFQSLDQYVEKVRRYDTWEWTDVYGDIIPKHFNDIFWLYGIEAYEELVYEKIMDAYEAEFILGDEDYLVLKVNENAMIRYVEKAVKALTKLNVGRYNIGVTFADQHIDEVAQRIYNEHDVDAVAVVNMLSRKVSYRTNKDNVDVNKFAQYFGGGGRTKTAGSTLTESAFEDILSRLFQT